MNQDVEQNDSESEVTQPLLQRNEEAAAETRSSMPNGTERVYLAACVALSICFFVSLGALFSKTNCGSSKSYCVSEDCVLSAGELIKSVNWSVDPCTDFYEYTCGNWKATHSIPDDKGRIGVFDELSERNQVFFINQLSNLPLDKENKEINEKMSLFFESCMDLSKINDNALDSLKFVASEIKNNLLRNVLEVNVPQLWKYGANSLISFSVSSDNMNPTKQVLVLSPGGLGFPTKEYYEPNPDVHEMYKRTIENVLKLVNNSSVFTNDEPVLPEPNPDFQKIAIDIFDFESKIANISPSSEEAANVEKTYNVMSLQEIQQKYSYLNWQSLVNGYLSLGNIYYNESYKNIIVTWPKFFVDLENILKNTSPVTLTYYMKLRMLMSKLDDAGDYSDLLKEYRLLVNGVKRVQERSKICVSKTEQALGFALSRLFLQKLNFKEVKEKVTVMVDSILNSFAKNLEQVSWMEPNVLQEAKLKIQKMRKKIAYPDFITNAQKLRDYYSKLEVETDYFKNILSTIDFANQREVMKLTSPTDKELWEMLPHQVNAYYNPSNNEIVFPLGILQAPFFAPDAPDYINYGAIGVVIGHELSHAFDNTGRKFDSNGVMRDWWSSKTSMEFENRAKCFANQYSQFKVPVPNGFKNLNGNLTLGENLADNAGLLQSLNAMPSTNKLLPMDLNPEKLFFVSFAHVWCGREKPEYLLQLVNGNPHSPGFARVLGTIQNSKKFQQVFQCPISRMNPALKCELW